MRKTNGKTTKGIFVGKLFFFLSFLTLFFVGCSDKNESISNIQMEQAIVNTKKARLELADGSVLLVTATYMNNIKRYFENENHTIVLGYHYSPANEESVKLGEMQVKLNGKIVSTQEIKYDDGKLKDISNYNAWSKYFAINSPKSDEATLWLVAEIYPFSEVRLNLLKVP